MYGKTHSEESINKIHNSLLGNKCRAKRVVCEGRYFISAKECAEYYSIPPARMRKWLNGNRHMPQEFVDKGLTYVD